MTIEEIEKLASRGHGIPKSLNQPEQLLFLSLRYLYRSYRSGEITMEQAKIEKCQILENFNVALTCYKANTEMTKRINAAHGLLSEAIKCGCDVCKKMSRLICGIDKY